MISIQFSFNSVDKGKDIPLVVSLTPLVAEPTVSLAPLPTPETVLLAVSVTPLAVLPTVSVRPPRAPLL